MKYLGWYYLDELNNPQPCFTDEDMKKSGKQKRIARTEVGEIVISTVFLGLDHSTLNYGPVLFETMVFGGKYDQWGKRYSFYEDSLKGHERTVQAIEWLED